jgi:hypothetical protein
VIKLVIDDKAFDEQLEQKRKEFESKAKIKLRPEFGRQWVPELERGSRVAGGILEKAAVRVRDTLKDAGRQFGQMTSGMGRVGAMGVAAGAGAVGLASSASPQAADTLSGSIKLTSAIIGKDFLPILAELAFTIQDLGQWWKGLDDGLKKNIVTTTKMVATAGAAGVAIAGIGAALSMLARHPLALAGMAAGAVLYKWWDQRQNQDAMLQAVHERRLDRAGLLKQNEDRAKGGGVLRGIFGAAGGALGVDGNKAFDLGRANAEVREAAREAFKANMELDQFRRKNIVGQGIDALIGLGGAEGMGDKLAKRAARAGKDLQDAIGRRRLIEEGPDADLPDGSGKTRKQRYLLGLAGPTSFSQTGDLLKSIQMAGTSSPIENETVKMQMEGNALLRDIERNTRKDNGVENN